MTRDYVYESPDGGKTVYKRKFNSREKILISKPVTDVEDVMDRYRGHWDELSQNPIVKDAIDKLLVAIALTK
tara:strand:+ start:3965 stop:4180 length:216 start_codon:yes stop_codon:yes gene_type:complete